MGNLSKAKILFTGGWERMSDNLMTSLSGKHKMLKCISNEDGVQSAFKEFGPDILVVSLSAEADENIQMIEMLKALLVTFKNPVFIIALEEELKKFSEFDNVEPFVRPLDTNSFFKKLQAAAANFVKEIDPIEVEKSNAELLREKEAMLKKFQSGAKPTTESELVFTIEQLTLIHGRKSVLVVDDDVRMLNVIKMHLQDLYDVTVVPSGKLAVKFLHKKSADLMLLDYLMPEMNGIQVMHEVRTSGSVNCNIPVLFLTGVAEKDKVMLGLKYQPSGYLLKPVTRMALLEKVTEIVLGLL